MSIWSNELAYNLFTNYEDWYQNFINETRVEPSEELKQEAKLYFEYSVSMVEVTKDGT